MNICKIYFLEKKNHSILEPETLHTLVLGINHDESRSRYEANEIILYIIQADHGHEPPAQNHAHDGHHRMVVTRWIACMGVARGCRISV